MPVYPHQMPCCFDSTFCFACEPKKLRVRMCICAYVHACVRVWCRFVYRGFSRKISDLLWQLACVCCTEAVYTWTLKLMECIVMRNMFRRFSVGPLCAVPSPLEIVSPLKKNLHSYKVHTKPYMKLSAATVAPVRCTYFADQQTNTHTHTHTHLNLVKVLPSTPPLCSQKSPTYLA